VVQLLFILGRGFSVETLTKVTPLWKTESNKSISAIEDRISRWLQYHHKVCFKKGGCHERQALIIGKECTMEMCFLDEWT